MASQKYTIGRDEFKKGSNIWRSLVAEFVGTFILNFFGCMSCTLANASIASMALAFGLAVFVAVMAIGHVSGGHINPAVTIGFLSVGRLSVLRSILYILVQCAGAISGSACVRILLPEQLQGGLGHTAIGQLQPLQGLGVEFFLGFVLVLVVFGVCDENKPDVKYIAPLAIGLTVTLGHVGTIMLTGTGMNPARALGSAAISGVWDNHWVYWVGPILGGVGAALMYTLCFAAERKTSVAERYSTEADDKEMRRLDQRKGAC